MKRRTAGIRAGSISNLLLEILDHAFDRSAWHGPNLMGSIKGVSYQDAARRLGERKTIWEQVLHAAYWKQRVVNKLADTERFPRKGSNWPMLPDEISKSAWRKDVQLLTAIHQRLREVVARLPAKRMSEYPVRRLIHGAAFHDIYHAGQIRLLRRLIRASGHKKDP